MKPSTHSDLSSAQRFGLALAGVIACQNGYCLDRLHPSEGTTENKATAAHLLKRDWEIHTTADLENSLEWLAANGQNRQFMEMLVFLSALETKARERFVASRKQDAEQYAQLRIVARSIYRLHRAGIFAWDCGRYVMLCRWGAMIDLISDALAWQRIIYMAGKVQPLFPDWYTYGISYATGRHFWRASRSADHVDYLMRHIQQLSGENAPWRMPWPRLFPQEVVQAPAHS
jgi:hypothetical protein